MDPILYNAVMEGQVDVLRQHIDQLDGLLTPNHNTLLHIAVQFGQLECTKKIFEGCQSLARRVNIKGETPLHIAAREGYVDIVKTLIESTNKLEQELEGGWGGATKEMLRATNVDGDTALHMAVRNCHFDVDKYLEVVELLTREDPEFQHPANSAEETPLYLAVELGDRVVKVVNVLLKACESPSYSGPSGRTALHVAALNDSTGQTVKILSEWKRDLIKKTDVNGWIPIHYASYTGNEEGVKQLLEMDISIASTTTADEDGSNTALHIAATHGYRGVMEVLLSSCPDCWEAINSRGQNILHIAVDMERENVMKFISVKSWSRHLINQKDNEGNTPLHISNYKSNSVWYHERAATGEVFNNKNMTPEEELSLSNLDEDAILLYARKRGRRNITRNTQDDLAKLKRAYRKRKEASDRFKKERDEAEEKKAEKMAKTHMIVATLITTISFAAAFAIPGGYDGNKDPEQGMAVLSRTAAFKAFLVTNTIAIACSVSSVFLYLFASFYIVDGERGKMVKRYQAAVYLILVAMISMMLAFITATFAVLAHSLALPIATCTIACVTFVLFFVEFFEAFPSIRHTFFFWKL